MPRIHPNRTAGARHGAALRGGSQPGAEHPTLSKGARRARRKLIREAKALTDASDWEMASRQLGILKRRWAMLRPIHPQEEQPLRRQFEAACAEVARGWARRRRDAERLPPQVHVQLDAGQ
jgi:hypothetical protein